MLKLTSLRKTFGEIVAVDDLTLEIERGEAFGLLGPNGAGKSTTIHMCTGLVVPTAGSVELDGGGSPTARNTRARMGVAPQSIALYDDLTGRENLAFFGRLQGLGGERLRERVEAALEFAGLAERQHSLVETYSGGMKRRLNLAVALLHEPEIVFLDEPTVGVDPQSRHAIMERILDLKRRGLTVVYCTHYMEEAEKLCDRVGIIDHGKLIAVGPVRELLAEHGGLPVIHAVLDGEQIEEPAENPVEALARLSKRGELKDFWLESPNLESVFLHLTGRSLRD